jgi:outer membrane lipoprotein-sorting protein
MPCLRVSSSPETSEERSKLMSRKSFVLFLAVSLSLSLAAVAQTAPKLTAAQIIEKNVAARGGLQAWRSVQTMTWKGKMDAGTGDSAARSRAFAMSSIGKMQPASRMSMSDKAEAEKQVQLPFTSEMKRGRKKRIELEFAGKTAVQVYDGSNGWLVRPYLNRNDVELFTAEQLQSEGQSADLDGYLVDYAAKGNKVDMEGVEKVEGKDAYKLKVTQKSGDVKYIWIDAQSFLDVRVSGPQRRMDGKMHNVYVYQRDFRSVSGVMVPYTLETTVEGYRDTHKMVLESVVINPKLDDSLFTKPAVAASAAPPTPVVVKK